VEYMINVSTYQGLAQYLITVTGELKSEHNMEIILLSEYLNMFESVSMPISEFDKYLLKGHIQQQRKLVLMIQ